jgi:2-polyprenyl-3-methyl-5-hydroxy-6-metoxy-1,4-benzoquinol methylase
MRPRLIRRVELLRTRFGISAQRLKLRCADAFYLDLEPGAFEVVLCLGLVCHFENPIGAIRMARALDHGVCVIESQLTRQVEAMLHGNGQSNQYEESQAGLPHSSRPITRATCSPPPGAWCL